MPKLTSQQRQAKAHWQLLGDYVRNFVSAPSKGVYALSGGIGVAQPGVRPENLHERIPYFLEAIKEPHLFADELAGPYQEWLGEVELGLEERSFWDWVLAEDKIQTRNSVIYYTAEQRRAYRVKFKSDVPYYPYRAGTPSVFEVNSTVIFVRMPNDALYARQPEIGTIHHSSLAGGGRVRTAGEMHGNESTGFRIKWFSLSSGHYRLAEKTVLPFLNYLRSELSDAAYNAIEFQRSRESLTGGIRLRILGELIEDGLIGGDDHTASTSTPSNDYETLSAYSDDGSDDASTSETAVAQAQAALAHGNPEVDTCVADLLKGLGIE